MPSGVYQRISDEERFWNKVAIIPFHTCWEWIGTKNKKGYGSFDLKGKRHNAHRASYIFKFGKIQNRQDLGPHGLCVLHKCDNPGCVNPDHLFLGSNKDNVADMISKGRRVKSNSIKTHCKYGHEFSVENTQWINGNERRCKICSRLKYQQNKGGSK